MSKRRPMDKAQARERRNRLLASAAAAELSLTEGVREMRAIAGMTQEEFARHREVSARVIKAIELGQGNPTVATLNRIGEFFGLQVGFVPINRTAPVAGGPHSITASVNLPATHSPVDIKATIGRSEILRQLQEMATPDAIQEIARKIFMEGISEAVRETLDRTIEAYSRTDPLLERQSEDPGVAAAPARKRKRTPAR
ncbi:helix-turn-helix transcriptional regulator [Massilia consociata]|uniref:Helix-turn-helix transcriptional regulator n=1 Tax=Massilia consociata TaxID=760117 RepID=A0ABV6FIN5_9BURK